jgi:hypothetical protein
LKGFHTLKNLVNQGCKILRLAKREAISFK